MSILSVKGAAKRFGSITALNGTTFSVEAGEFFCLLGPSAAGKTTTLRAIAGLDKLDAGSVVFDGQDLTHQPVQGRDMAMVFQTFALYPHLTARDNLAYPLREAGQDAARVERRVGEIAELLRITHTLGRKPATLSGGEQQRLAIGRALVREPKLLLLDEPLTNLDAKLRHDMRAEFKRLHRELGTTMLYATPDQLEALSMGERVAVIKDGWIVQVDTPRSLYTRPDDSFVATLVGAPTMNLLPVVGQVARGGTVSLSFGEVSGGPWAKALSEFAAETELLFGFRPQDISPAKGDQKGLRFDAKVHLTEPLGDITVLDLAAADAVFKMVLPEEEAMQYNVGDELAVDIRIDKTHLFARETGTAIR